MTERFNFDNGARIRVADADLAVELTLSGGPANMMVREAFQNALEAFLHPSETFRTVQFRAKSVPVTARRSSPF